MCLSTACGPADPLIDRFCAAFAEFCAWEESVSEIVQ